MIEMGGMGALAATALVLGVAYAATPGVVNTECVRRGLARGFRPALKVQLGALIGDGLWALLALTGVATLARNATLQNALALVGGLFLCRLAFKALREAATGPDAATVKAVGGDFRTGAIFGLANPAGFAFWVGVGGGAVSTGAGHGGVAAYAGFLLAFTCGALIWSLALSTFVSWGKRWVSPAVFRAVDAFCGAILGFFGVRLLWGVFRRLTP